MVWDLLSRFAEMSKEILDSNLVGIYLHGSAVMGCFNSQESDLDLILIVENDIPNAVKMEFMRNVIQLNKEAPKKGIELSVVKKVFCNPFVYPTPFELHFSNTHIEWFQENPEDYVEKMKGTDKDLAAHFTVINNYGITLFGEKINEVFGSVPRDNYIDSIWLDVRNAREDILFNSVYVILNLCRVLAFLQDESVLSKKTGGEWGLRILPTRFYTLIQDALRSYDTGEVLIFPSETALDFADYMILQIEQYVLTQ